MILERPILKKDTAEHEQSENDVSGKGRSEQAQVCMGKIRKRTNVEKVGSKKNKKQKRNNLKQCQV